MPTCSPTLIRGPLAPEACAEAAVPVVVLLRADRRTLGKRLWRASAEDGMDFGFQLERPLRHGEAFHSTATALYRIEQEPEPVLVVDLEGMAASAAAAIGWAVGNLHLDFSSEPGRLLAPDEPAARRLFERIQISYTTASAVFRAGRFARGRAAAQELGPALKHPEGTSSAP